LCFQGGELCYLTLNHNMADGAPIGYSPSGWTPELIDFTITRPSSRPSSRVSFARSNLSWHPKSTLYRLLAIFSTVGSAAAKTATTGLNFLCFHHSRVDSGSGGILIVSFGDSVVYINLRWVSFYLLGAYEETNNRYFTWFFNFDCMEFLWVFLENFTGFSRLYYISDEIDARHQAVGIHPPLRGYRILVTIVVASVGMTKCGLLYGQQPREATIVECVFGVGIVTGWPIYNTKALPPLTIT